MKIESKRLPFRTSSEFIGSGRLERHRIFIWGLMASALLVALYSINTDLFQHFDLKNYDMLLRHYPDNHKSDKVVIVDLDEQSLKRFGQWPWPRYRVAGLLEKISALKPSVISLDMVFPEPDRTSMNRLLDDLKNEYHLNLSIDNFPEGLRDNDQILAKTLTRGPFVLGHKFHFNSLEKSSEQCILRPVRASLLQNGLGKEEKTRISESVGVLCNLPQLAEKVDYSGFFNFSPDKDGMLRRLPLLIKYKEEFYPSLALATIMRLNQTNNLLLNMKGGVLQTIKIMGTTVPVDEKGQILVKFRGPGRTYEYISASEILDGKVPLQNLQGRLVCVGTSASGLKDFRTTAFDSIFSGVEVHATVIDNLLAGDFISVPDWSKGVSLVVVLVTGVLLSYVVSFRGAASGFTVMLVLTAGLWLVTQQVFYRMGLFVGTVFPIVSVICNYIFLTVLKYRLEEKKMVSSLRELVLTQDITIESMANLAEYRDPDTGSHITRTRMYVKLLAEHIRHQDKYKDFLTDENIDMLYKSTPLHDIGKVGIPDNILLKPKQLTTEEFEIMKTHTNIGRDVIESSIRKLGKQSFLTIALEISQSHQEKWDGSGYPQGLKGNDIPISGRLMALADVYDALISRRVYKPPFSHSESVAIIKKGRGTHFDPDLVDAFLEIHEKFKEISIKYADSKDEASAMDKDQPGLNASMS